MSGTTQGYTKSDEFALQDFVGDVLSNETKSGVRMDSTAAAHTVLDAFKNESGVNPPAALQSLLEVVTGDDSEQKVVKAIFDGVTVFEREHGFRPTGDLLLSALHQGRSVFDSVTNGHHDQISINPNAPLVAIMGAMAEACPFAGYLPADKGSNEAKLIIVNHMAGSDWGGYAQSAFMDGIAAGEDYLSSGRTATPLTAPNDTTNYKFNFTARSDGTGAALRLLRGRCIVYVNGQRAATEVQNGGSAAAQVPLSGTVRLGGTDYTISGNVKPTTGEVVVTPAPAFPNGTSVTVEAFVDYEADSTVTPRMNVIAQSFSLFANPFRGIFQITPEARSQFANEVGVDAGAEAMLTVRGQFALERHYDALRKIKMIGKFIQPVSYNFRYADQIQQKSLAQMWQDFAAVLGAASQKMAENTGDHGITHLYVGMNVASQLPALPRDMFEPSGITARPGIYRLGRLFGLYEVYYSPKFIAEAADGTSAEIVAVGRSSQTARCPIIMGDASAPVFEPLGTGTDLRSGYGFHARSFTATNPHDFSAKGCALFTITNLK